MKASEISLRMNRQSLTFHQRVPSAVSVCTLPARRSLISFEIHISSLGGTNELSASSFL
jgi:hypothetical protein